MNPGPKPDPSKPRSRHNPDNISRSRPKKEKPARSHCKRGHELTESNIRYNTRGAFYCGTCAAENTANNRNKNRPPQRDRKDKYAPERLSVESATCRNGHTVTLDTVVVHADGSRRCRQCVKDNGQKQRLKKYGLTQEQYEELLTRQDGKCAVCKTPMDGVRNEHIDHDHATGQVRGLLCSHCNTAIGKFKDNPDILIAAAQYLMDSWRLSD